MKYGSLFTGIGGFDLGFDRAGMTCEWQVEIDDKCWQVLTRRWPDVEKHRDVKEVGKHNLAAVDIICGGFPCQDLSVAGKRAGLDGERSGLWFEFHRVIAELRPGWVVIENVPGLLSSNSGRDFAVILRGLVELGYGAAWRVLDAQYFGVAQRRRRVFVVASLGSGRAAEILFEREGGAWDTAPSREAGQGFAADASCLTPWDCEAKRIHSTDGVMPTMATASKVSGTTMPWIAAPLTASGRGTERAGESRGQDTVIAVAAFDPRNITSKANRTRVEPGLPANTLHSDGLFVAFGGNRTSGEIDVATAVNAGHGSRRYDFESETFVAFSRNDDGRDATENLAPTMRVGTSLGERQGMPGNLAVAYGLRAAQTGSNGWGIQENLSHTLDVAAPHRVASTFGVRRLTPTECARLQGFPDDWAAEMSDSVQYRMYGNAVCTNVSKWIAKRIVQQEQQ